MRQAANMYTDGSYHVKNPSWDVEDSAWKAGHIRQLLAKNQLSPRRVADVGCGAGQVLRELVETVPTIEEAVGFDISPQAIELCQRSSTAGLRFECLDFLTESSECFDLLLLVDVIEHVDDPHDFLQQLASRSRWKLLHIPLELSAQSVLRGKPLLEAWHGVGHLHFFTAELALTMIERAGYRVLDHHFTWGGLDLPRRWRTKFLSYPRRILRHLDEDLASRLFGGSSLMVLAR